LGTLTSGSILIALRPCPLFMPSPEISGMGHAAKRGPLGARKRLRSEWFDPESLHDPMISLCLTWASSGPMTLTSILEDGGRICKTLIV